MSKLFLCSSRKDSGKFLCFSWELWSIGGGAGLQWYFFKKEIHPNRFNPLWLIFKWQRRGNNEKFRFILFCFAIIVCCVLFNNCSIDDCNKLASKYNNSGKLTLLCIGGHKYYHVDGAYSGYIVIKLSDSGKPIKCNE